MARLSGWYLPVRAGLLLAAVAALVLGSALDSVATVFVAPLALVATAALDLDARRRDRQVPTAATVVGLAAVMGVAGLADRPPGAAAWTFIGLCALAVVLALGSATNLRRDRRTSR